jgi:hypothetical protein
MVILKEMAVGRERKILREEKGGTEIERKMEVKISELTLNTYIMQLYYVW